MLLFRPTSCSFASSPLSDRQEERIDKRGDPCVYGDRALFDRLAGILSGRRPWFLETRSVFDQHVTKSSSRLFRYLWLRHGAFVLSSIASMLLMAFSLNFSKMILISSLNKAFS